TASASASMSRIPQVHGPSSSSSESPSPPPSQNNYTPRASHPSPPQPSPNSAPAKVDDSEAINSDLDVLVRITCKKDLQAVLWIRPVMLAQGARFIDNA
ncbi:hypothetical protein BD310DRAFT_932091, partial [Dichomitus squalens]